MTVAELKAALSGLGLAVKGTKGILVARLEEAQASAAGLTTAAKTPHHEANSMLVFVV